MQLASMLSMKAMLMGLYKNENGDASVECVHTALLPMSQRKEVAFRFTVVAHGFSARLNQLWFEDYDLENFFAEAIALTASAEGTARLISMSPSEFELTIKPSAPGGHFILEFCMADLFRGNKATLSVELVTQQVDDLIAELKKPLQISKPSRPRCP